MASLLFFKRRRHHGICSIPSQATPSFRKIADSEYQAINQYLQDYQPVNKPDKSKITLSYQEPISVVRKHAIITTVCNSVTRFNLHNDKHHTWRYFIDTVEVHLPYQLEPYLQQQNVMEVVDTNHLPLIISVNNYSIKDLMRELPVSLSTTMALPEPAAIQEGGQQTIKVMKIRKETPEEYRLHQSSGWIGAGLLCASFLFCFFALTAIPILSHWMMLGAELLFIASILCLFNLRLTPKKYQDVQCIIGKPKRWELFGEFNEKQAPNISLGSVDLIYPPHWAPYIHYELDQAINIDMYSNGQVLRQGQYLSLNEEERYFPYRKYGKNMLIMIGSLLVLILMLVYSPINLPLKLGFTWLSGTDTIEVSHFTELETLPLKVGDSLSAKGVGMCYMPPNLATAEEAQFSPFDCSGIYWNNLNSLPIPESPVVDTAASLLAEIQRQLHPNNDDARNINPQLQEEILKSGMNILDDFSEIILKTNQLCPQDNDCQKLKNALTNLTSKGDWLLLVSEAKQGKLKNANVILRTGSADTLEKLIEATTYKYIRQEVEKASVRLNSPPPGGVLLISDEGKPLVDFISSNNMNEMTPLHRWHELQRLSDILMHTPFEIQGIITHLSLDANGTRRIILHSEPDTTTLTRYMGSTLLFLILIGSALLNGFLVINRIRLNKKRLRNIQQYYDNCFNAAYPPIRWR